MQQYLELKIFICGLGSINSNPYNNVIPQQIHFHQPVSQNTKDMFSQKHKQSQRVQNVEPTGLTLLVQQTGTEWRSSLHLSRRWDVSVLINSICAVMKIRGIVTLLIQAHIQTDRSKSDQVDWRTMTAPPDSPPITGASRRPTVLVGMVSLEVSDDRFSQNGVMQVPRMFLQAVCFQSTRYWSPLWIAT